MCIRLIAGLGLVCGIRKALPLALLIKLIISVRKKSRKPKSRDEATPINIKGPVHLAWKDVTLTLSKGRHAAGRTLLSSISGEAKPGRLLAILGPSGGGKTSLLNAIGGVTRAEKGLSLHGSLLVNGSPSPSAPSMAYIQQSEAFFSMLTTREALIDACLVRRPDLSKIEREDLVENIVSTLGLKRCLDTRVGDTNKRGLSGGEIKRLSIAIELLGSPQCILADEVRIPLKLQLSSPLPSADSPPDPPGCCSQPRDLMLFQPNKSYLLSRT